MKVTESTTVIRRVEPAKEGNWLTRVTEDGVRVFSQLVFLGKDADPAEWEEITDKKKKQLEAAASE